jgi:predicted nucleic acid-binding protein
VFAVVDTDVVSFIFKGDTRAALYQTHLAGQVLIISPMTRAELEQWALERNWGMHRRDSMRAYLRQYILAPFDEAICLRWAEARNSARKNGRPIGTADAWVAAAALLYASPLVTHNRSHYAGIHGLTLVSENTP